MKAALWLHCTVAAVAVVLASSAARAEEISAADPKALDAFVRGSLGPAFERETGITLRRQPLASTDEIRRAATSAIAGDALVDPLAKGTLDAPLLYRSLAVQARLPHLELPDEITSSTPGKPAFMPRQPST